MKHDNVLRLARLSHSNVMNGGASAMVLARRAQAITGSSDAMDIVTEVYSASSRQSPVVRCRECGSEHFGGQAAEECCREEE